MEPGSVIREPPLPNNLGCKPNLNVSADSSVGPWELANGLGGCVKKYNSVAVIVCTHFYPP
jgi:hypothetical protein